MPGKQVYERLLSATTVPFLEPPTDLSACRVLLFDPEDFLPGPLCRHVPRSILLLKTLTLHPELANHVRSFTVQRLGYLGDPSNFSNNMELYYDRLKVVLGSMQNLKEITITTDDFGFYIRNFGSCLEDFTIGNGAAAVDALEALMDVKTDLYCFVQEVLMDEDELAYKRALANLDLTENGANMFFREEMETALQECVERNKLVKLTVNDRFNHEVYLNFYGNLLKQPNIKSISLHGGKIHLIRGSLDGEGAPLRSHCPREVLPELESFDGQLEDYFCLLPFRESLREVRVVADIEQLSTFGAIGQEILRHFSKTPELLTNVEDMISKIRRLEIAHSNTSDDSDFRFLQPQLPIKETFIPDLFEAFADLTVLVLPATFTHYEAPETMDNFTMLRSLQHLIVGATAQPWNGTKCPLGSDLDVTVWGHLVNAMYGTEIHAFIMKLMERNPAIRCVDVKTHLYPSESTETHQMCGCKEWKLGRVLYVDGERVRSGRRFEETRWGDDLSKIAEMK